MQGSPKQSMDFLYNVFADNEISGAFPTLNQRTRSHAVVILSSSNINMNRNHLVNPGSQYEISTHLLELAVVLQATAQWWGTTDYRHIITRIFDQYRSVALAGLGGAFTGTPSDAKCVTEILEWGQNEEVRGVGQNL